MLRIIQTTIALLLRLIFRAIFHIETPKLPDELPDEEGVIIVCNHHSMLDPFVWGAAVPLRRPFTPVRFISKQQYLAEWGITKNWPTWIIGPADRALLWVIKRLGAIPRGHGMHEQARAALARGESIFLFVEAGISKDALIERVASGAPRLAITCGALVLHMAIWGTLEKEHRYNRRHFKIGAGRLTRVVHNPKPDVQTINVIRSVMRDNIREVQKHLRE